MSTGPGPEHAGATALPVCRVEWPARKGATPKTVVGKEANPWLSEARGADELLIVKSETSTKFPCGEDNI